MSRRAPARPARRRARQEEIEKRRKERREAQDALRASQKAEGLEKLRPPSIPNRISSYDTKEEEQAARQDATINQLQVLRMQLPGILERLSKIKDHRDPKRIDHQLTMVLVYGMLSFVFHMSSRREANRTMTRPAFMEKLRLLFPDLDKLPHHDSVARLLSEIDVDQIEHALLDVVRRLIRNKKFEPYLIDGRYPIAIDGSQKLVRMELLSEQWSERMVSTKVSTGVAKDETAAVETATIEAAKAEVATTETATAKVPQYHVTVVEASLSFPNGMIIPLLSEFVDYTKGDTSSDKQDCEQRAFRRLADRLKREFPRLPIVLQLDGLYANGPNFEYCREKNWDFMTVLQDKSLPTVWEEYNGLQKLDTTNELRATNGDRKQLFRWSNGIEYSYGPNESKRQIINVVVCQEEWEEINPETNQREVKSSRHAWISDKPLTHKNVQDRCNLMGRKRWGIESGFNVEKHQGYQYEHCFSYNWDAMRGYHYLMRFGHLLNTLAIFSQALTKIVRELGVRGFIAFIRETITGNWLDFEVMRRQLDADYKLRLR